jgi:hypothetical protein
VRRARKVYSAKTSELSLFENAPRELGWRFEREKDRAKLVELRTRFPTRDLIQAIKDLVETSDPIVYWQKKHEIFEGLINQSDDVATPTGFVCEGCGRHFDQCRVLDRGPICLSCVDDSRA